MSDTRYGFYLRPSAAMCRAQAEVHALLDRQYNLRVAGRFMPHATVKGFFRSDATLPEIVERIDGAMADRAPVTVTNRGPIAFGGSSIVLDVHHEADGATNAPLQALHEASIAAILPVVHSDCDFTPREWLGPMFFAHLTLAMADLPERFAAEVLEFVNDLGPIGPDHFVADTFQLFAFQSDDWGDQWWSALEWELLQSWRLG